VIAVHERGFSIASTSNIDGARVQTVPSQMIQLVRGPDTSATQIQIIWSAPVSGGTSIISYQLDILNESGVWIEVVGNSNGNYLGLSYTLTVGIVAGRTYQFRIRAQNKWGWGAYTAVNTSILAASVPSYVINT
jgi:hypothetical protein